MLGDGGTGPRPVVEAHETGQPTSEFQQVAENDADIVSRLLHVLDDPRLRPMVSGGDRGMGVHERKRVHPGDVVPVSHLDIVAKLDSSLLPPDIVFAEEASKID